MRIHFRRRLSAPPLFLIAFLAAVAGTQTGLGAQKGPAIADVLKLGGEALVQYSQHLGAMVAEEEYRQMETSSGQMGVPKRVISDVVWLGRGDGSVEGFRDVIAIDRVPVRPKDDRLSALFAAPGAASLTQARQMTEDAVRQYLDGNLHFLDQPMMALTYLQPANQARSTFKIDGVKNMNGAQVAVLKFTEQGTPRLQESPENAAAIGRIWIDVATGTVRQTELGLGGRSSNIIATVKYTLDAASSLWLPSEMSQQVSVTGGASSAGSNMGGGGGYSGHQAAEGSAAYSKYRQVPVDLGKLR